MHAIMGIGPLGLTELLVIGAILLLLFGTRKLPELARGLGSGIREFRRAKKEIGIDELQEVKKELQQSIDVGTSAKKKILHEVSEVAKSIAEPAEKLAKREVK